MSTQSTSSSRPYWAGRWEERFDRGLSRALRRRGWTPRVEAYTGYGLAADTGEGWVRVLARVVVVPAAPVGRRGRAAPVALPDAAPRPDSAPRRRSRRSVSPEHVRPVRGWRGFVTAQVPGARVQIIAGTVAHEVLADRGGYIDVTLPSTLAEGWHDIQIVPEGGLAASAPVRVLPTRPCTGLVSDVDDTVMVTMLPRPLTALWNLFVLHEDARRPVPGMAQLYAELGGLDATLPVVYLSTNAWNVAPALRRFLAHHHFPAGPLLLTDWGPTNTGLFRSGPEHKSRALERLTGELPHMRWILVGDDGQRDPQIYRAFARARPETVRAVVIRELSRSQHVFAHGAPAPADATRAHGAVVTGTTIPEVRGSDGQSLSHELHAAHILPPPLR